MSLADQVTFDDRGLIPAVVCSAADNRPLVLCYLTREALEKTLETGFVHVFRRSRGRLMLKGEVSGHTQKVVDVFVNCDSNSLLIAVEQRVAACAHGYFSCYYRRYDQDADAFELIAERIFDPEQVY